MLILNSLIFVVFLQIHLSTIINLHYWNVFWPSEFVGLYIDSNFVLQLLRRLTLDNSIVRISWFVYIIISNFVLQPLKSLTLDNSIVKQVNNTAHPRTSQTQTQNINKRRPKL